MTGACGTLWGGAFIAAGSVWWANDKLTAEACEEIDGICDTGGKDCGVAPAEPGCEETEAGDVGGEPIKWLGECKSGELIKIGGLAATDGGRGTAVILARSDWNDVDGEYMDAIAGGSICGGALLKKSNAVSEIQKIYITVFCLKGIPLKLIKISCG